MPPLGDGAFGFPYLSGAGRLVLKDVVLMAGAWLCVADSARALVTEGWPAPGKPARAVAPAEAVTP